MERDLLFPAVVCSVLFRSLLFLQVSDREKKGPAGLKSSQDALHIKKGLREGSATAGLVKAATKEEDRG